MRAGANQHSEKSEITPAQSDPPLDKVMDKSRIASAVRNFIPNHLLKFGKPY